MIPNMIKSAKATKSSEIERHAKIALTCNKDDRSLAIGWLERDLDRQIALHHEDLGLYAAAYQQALAERGKTYADAIKKPRTPSSIAITRGAIDNLKAMPSPEAKGGNQH